MTKLLALEVSSLPRAAELECVSPQNGQLGKPWSFPKLSSWRVNCYAYPYTFQFINTQVAGFAVCNTQSSLNNCFWSTRSHADTPHAQSCWGHRIHLGTGGSFACYSVVAMAKYSSLRGNHAALLSLLLKLSCWFTSIMFHDYCSLPLDLQLCILFA